MANDAERTAWVENDEGLYMWWKNSRQSKQQFVRENRKEIDRIIDHAINEEPE